MAGGSSGRSRIKIDRDELRALVAAGHSTNELATHFSTTRSTIIRILHQERIPLPARRYAGRVVGKPQPVAEPVTVHPPRTAALIATGWRYADLAAWARDWGVTETKARQEWHALRLPIRKGGSA